MKILRWCHVCDFGVRKLWFFSVWMTSCESVRLICVVLNRCVMVLGVIFKREIKLMSIFLSLNIFIFWAFKLTKVHDELPFARAKWYQYSFSPLMGHDSTQEAMRIVLRVSRSCLIRVWHIDCWFRTTAHTFGS